MSVAGSGEMRMGAYWAWWLGVRSRAGRRIIGEPLTGDGLRTCCLALFPPKNLPESCQNVRATLCNDLQ